MPKIKYSKLIIQPQNGKSTCQAFVFDLPGEETENGTKPSPGQILGLFEIEAAPNKKIAAFLDALTQEIKMAAVSGFGKLGEKSLEEAFENFVQKTNYRYLEQASSKSSLFSEGAAGLPKINAVLVFENEKNIYLAQRGKILSFLIYQVKPQNYKIMNIAETAAGKEGRPSHLSLFTNIVSGKIGASDYLFFTTESILDYFSLEKICKTISATSPEAAADTLKNLLGEVANPETSFAFMIITPETETPIIKAAPAPSSPVPEIEQDSIPQHSMAGLLKTAADTEKMLTPSLGLGLGNRFSAFFGGFKNLFRKNEIKNNARLEYYSSQFHQPSGAGKFFRFLSLFFLTLLRIPYFLVKITLLFFYNLLKIIFYSITNWKGQRKIVFANAISGLKDNFRVLGAKTEKLPRLSRTLLAFAIIFIILFAGSTALLYGKYRNDAAAKSLQTKIEAIQTEKSSAEASLIYNDEEGAKNFLSLADALLAEFPQKNKKEKDAYENLSSEIEILREKLRHVVNTENPALIANFSDTNPGAEVDKFIIAGNSLYAFDSASSVIYKMDLKTNEVVNKSASNLNFKLAFFENESSALLYQPENKFFDFDLENDVLKELEVVLNENETQIDDLAVYNQKLYVLDAKDKQIFKHAGTTVGFGRGAPWLKEEMSFANAASLAIDGSIYIGTSDGKILKLENGRQVDFTPKIDPSFSSEIKIWTSVDSSFIYIMEPSSKRVAVFDKQGKLVVQYTSPKFDDLKGFFVSEKDKKIYLLSGNSVYEIPAAHLQ